MNALTALQNHASDLSNDEGGPQDASDDFFSANSTISVSSILDLSSVKTSSRRNQPTHSTPRPFGLQDCPVFYPTSDEFKDPITYIDSISCRVINYGICKVVHLNSPGRAAVSVAVKPPDESFCRLKTTCPNAPLYLPLCVLYVALILGEG